MYKNNNHSALTTHCPKINGDVVAEAGEAGAEFAKYTIAIRRHDRSRSRAREGKMFAR